jgi:cell division protein FtsB
MTGKITAYTEEGEIDDMIAQNSRDEAKLAALDQRIAEIEAQIDLYERNGVSERMIELREHEIIGLKTARGIFTDG